MAGMLLAFETVARTASACVLDDEGRELDFRDLAGGEAEGGLVAMLHGLLETHGRPTGLAVAVGPGSFTGLRIGLVAARTLAWCEELPIHAVDSLAALAAQQGDGTWWVLMPLKKDVTFHGLFTVQAGLVTVLVPTSAHNDEHPPHLPAGVPLIAVGPALSAKPGLAQRWCPGVTEGSCAGLTARGVAVLARSTPAQPWAMVMPMYHQDPAPVLQRRAALHVVA